MGFLKALFLQVLGTPYVTGAIVRQVVGVAATSLVLIGALDPALLDQWVNANVPVIIGLIGWLLQFGLSVKQKVEADKAAKQLQTELDVTKYNLHTAHVTLTEVREAGKT